MYAKLRQDHDQLRTILSGYFALMDADEGTARAVLLRERLAFSRAFQRHTAEERVLYARLLPVGALRTKAEHEMGQLLRDYGEHIRGWPPKRIDEEWPGYCRAVRELGQRLLARLAWEEVEVLPLLERRAALENRAAA